MADRTAWPAGENGTSALVRRTDWTATPLGPVEGWPASLRATVDMLLGCAFPMVALWGPELVQIYNDGYAEIMAAKHPRGMGQPTAECWPEVWAFNLPIYERVRGGETVMLQDQLFPIARHGYLEDASFSLCYSPLRDESQAVAGVLVTVFETTERVRVERALRQSEGRLRALVTATANVVYRMSSDWTRMQELYGSAYLSHTESADVAWLEKYIPPDSRPLVETTIAESIAAKRMFELEHRVYQADGSEGWVMSRAVPLLDARGAVYEWFGAAYDVTAVKQAEVALRESEAKYRTLFETMAEGFGIAELLRDESGNAIDWRILEVNPALERHTGMKPETVRGRCMREVYPQADLSASLAIYQRVVDRQQWESFEEFFAPLNRWMEVTASPGGGERFNIVYADVSERKAVEVRLRESEERQAFLLRLSDALRSLEDPRDIQQTASRMLGERFGVNRALYAEIEGEGDTADAVINGQFVRGVAPVPERVNYKLFTDGFPGELWRRGLPVVVEDSEIDPRFVQPVREAWRTIDTRSTLAIPLVKGGKEVVIFGFHSAAPRAWTEADINFVTQAVERTWAATERAIAEDALRQSEARERRHSAELRAVLESMTDAVYIGGRDGITLANQAALDQVGYTTTNELNRNISTLSAEVDGRDPETGERIPDEDLAFARALQGEQAVQEAVVRHRTTGEDRVLRSAAAPIKLDGRIIGAVAVNTDITDRKRAELKLQESEERQVFLLELSDVLRPLADGAEIQRETTRLLGEHLGVDRCYYFETDYEAGDYIIYRDFVRGNHRIIDGRPPNQQWPEMTAALGRGEMLVVDDYASSPHIPPGERPPTEDLDIRAIILIPLVKHGKLVACMAAIQTVPRRWKSGEVSLVADVAERTWAAVERARAEAALRESEERLRLFVENVREYALVQTDLQGTITSWNPGAERLFGFASEAMVGRALRELAEGMTEDVFAVEDETEKARGSLRVEKEEWLTRQDGTRFAARWVSEPVYDEVGGMRAVAHVLRDETDRNRAVSGRLIAAQEEERRRVARELHDDLGQRAALLGLEVGQLQGRNGELGAAGKESLGRLGGYVAALSEGLRNVSHRLHPSLLVDLGLPVALRALVEEHRGTGSDVEMHVGEIPALPIETATALYRIAQEALGNAERHAPGAPVRASLTRSDHYLELWIEDEGPGFDLAEARQRGTLGLTSMRERAQIAGGKLHLATRPGEGTTLRVTVPLRS